MALAERPGMSFGSDGQTPRDTISDAKHHEVHQPAG